ncbi:MAG: glutamate-5-semialdehyde dehydrogenase [Ruminococcaceae bacterium]|nr:glutamate-5-semialdehyde dehydrogenase [Oscillospiraceae bacterium]
MTDLIAMGREARAAADVLAVTSAEKKNEALAAISRALLDHRQEILEANRLDAEEAERNGMRPAMLDRLKLDDKRLASIAAAVMKVAGLDDPVGDVMDEWDMYNGLHVRKVRVPMGVVGIIYESRPNVTVDAAVLCLKSGNAAFLRGGRETIRSNMALERVMRQALASAGLPEACVTLLHDTDHAVAREMMGMRDYIDVLIPRGSARLIRTVLENAKVPVIETGVGNCHVFVDKTADLQRAAEIILNAKAQRVSVCNAAETLLVHEDVADQFLPMAKKLLDTKNVELRGDARTRAVLGDCVKEATEEDYYTEYLDYILAVKVVANVEEAVEHIRKYSTHHSEAILTNDRANADYFTSHIDSAALYVNASTRFTDGEEFGFGAEIGISTQKLHARGPMALRELCSYKYIVEGDGQIRQ